MAFIQINNTTSTTIEVYVTELDIEYGRNDRYINWYIGTTSDSMNYYGFQGLPSGVGSGDIFTFTNLIADTTYYVFAEIYYTIDGDHDSKALETVYTRTLEVVRPEKFYWNTLKHSGYEFNLTADEWNSLLNNINAVRNYKGLSNYGFTYAHSTGTFTAAMYNEVVSAIQDIAGYGSYLHTVSKGDTIYASLLNNLVSELNAVI